MHSILHSFSKYPQHQTVHDDSLFSKNLSYRCSTCFYSFIIHKSSYSVIVATCCIAIAYLYYVTLLWRFIQFMSTNLQIWSKPLSHWGWVLIVIVVLIKSIFLKHKHFVYTLLPGCILFWPFFKHMRKNWHIKFL